MTPETFTRQYVRRVGDRLSLTEREGRCALLEAPNHCTVYDARPKHCRDFPYWPDILAGGEALERARGYCPGIQVFPEREVRTRAFAELGALYQRLDEEIARRRPICIVRGVCCEFEKVDHALYASLLETDYAAAHGEEFPDPSLPNSCRFHVEGLCRNRKGRPLGCRTYFCDPTFRKETEELHERYYKEVREICARNGYPWGYGLFVEQLKARAARIRRESE